MDTIDVKFTTKAERYTDKGYVGEETHKHKLKIDRETIIKYLTVNIEGFYGLEDEFDEAVSFQSIDYNESDEFLENYNSNDIIPIFDILRDDVGITKFIYDFYNDDLNSEIVYRYGVNDLEVRITDLTFKIKKYTDGYYYNNEDVTYKINYKDCKEFFDDVYLDISTDKPILKSKMGTYEEDLRYLKSEYEIPTMLV